MPITAGSTLTTPLHRYWINCALNLQDRAPGTVMIMASGGKQNGSVVRKLYGYSHIPRHYATEFSELNSDQVYWYVNFHRLCYFPSTVTNDKGKEKKKYRYEDMMTPYEKFRSLSKPSQYLKPGMAFKMLDVFAREMTDNEAAEQLNSARDQLFKQLHERLKIEA